jgi:hypothetical protein
MLDNAARMPQLALLAIFQSQLLKIVKMCYRGVNKIVAFLQQLLANVMGL